jgi:hypothetical protein
MLAGVSGVDEMPREEMPSANAKGRSTCTVLLPTSTLPQFADLEPAALMDAARRLA